MERFKNWLRRGALVLMLLLGTAIGGHRSPSWTSFTAKGQSVVVDPTQIAASLVNALRELSEMMEQVNIAKDNLEWMDQIMDYAMQLQQLLQDVNVFANMFRSLEMQAQMLVQYGNLISDMGARGFNPAVISQLRYKLEFGYKSIQQMIEQGMKILSDVGLSKDKKMELAAQYAKNVENMAQVESDELVEAIDRLESEMMWRQFDNLLMGEDADFGIESAGMPPADDPAVEDGALQVGEGLGEDNPEAQRTGRMGFRMALIIVGFLLAFSLIGVTVRYMRGEPGSESGFVRIFVVLVFAIVLFTVLHTVMRL